MASDLITNLVGLFIKDRFEELTENHLHASDTQNEQLFNLLREAETTEWGKKHQFKSIVSYQDFRERLPVTTSDNLKPYLNKLSKGVPNLLWPGVPKQVVTSFNNMSLPITESALTEVYTQGVSDCFTLHLHQHPESRLFGGFFVRVGNDGEGLMMDELDDFLRQNEPFILSLLNRPRFTSMIQLSDNHLRQLINELRTEKVSSFHGTPASLDRLLQLAKSENNDFPDFIKEAEVLFHKTTQTTDQLRQATSTYAVPFPIQHAYCSPEGFIGIQDNENDESFLLMLDLSQFYEFIEVGLSDNLPIPLEAVNVDTDYQLVLTTCSGLWRYLSEGPHVRFVSTEPYRFLLV